MLFPVVLIGVGALLASRNRPKTQVTQLKAMGPVTGLEYTVEKMPEANIAIVRLPQACMAIRRFNKKWWHLQSKGRPEALAAMRKDFDVQFEPQPEPEALST